MQKHRQILFAIGLIGLPAFSAGQFPYGIAERVADPEGDSADHAYIPWISHVTDPVTNEQPLVFLAGNNSNLFVGQHSPAIIFTKAAPWSAPTFSELHKLSNGTYLPWVSRPSISRDGLFAAFYGADATGAVSAYVHDIANGITTPIPDTLYVTASGLTPSIVPPPVVSDVDLLGKRYVAYVRLSGIAGTVSLVRRWEINPITSPVPETVSATPTGVPANGNCASPAISADGSVIAYSSVASNLGAGGHRQVFRAVRSGTWTSEIASRVTDNNGTQGAVATAANALYNGTDFDVISISADGSKVAFSTLAQLDPNDTDTRRDVVVRDFSQPLGYRTTVRPYPQVTATASFQTTETFSPCLSGNGQIITYLSYRLLAGMQNADRFDYDLLGRPLNDNGPWVFAQKISSPSSVSLESYRASGGAKKAKNSQSPSLNHDGTTIVFSSTDPYIAYDPSVPVQPANGKANVYRRIGASW